VISAEEKIKLLEEQLNDKKQIIQFYETRIENISGTVNKLIYDLLIIECEHRGYRRYYSEAQNERPNQDKKFISREEWNQYEREDLFYVFHHPREIKHPEVNYAEFITKEDAYKCIEQLFAIPAVKKLFEDKYITHEFFLQCWEAYVKKPVSDIPLAFIERIYPKDDEPPVKPRKGK